MNSNFEYWTFLSRYLYVLFIRNVNKNLPAGVGAVGLIVEALTRLSKLTSAEFSPKKDCGVFFTAPVLAVRFSAMLSRSKGSPDVVPPIPKLYNFNGKLTHHWRSLHDSMIQVPLLTVCGLAPSFPLLVITSNSSKSLSGLVAAALLLF